MVEILSMQPEHWLDVRKIYEEGLATGNATFQTIAPEWEEWDSEHVKSCRIVARENGIIIGWAALSPVSGRCVYGGVAEVSVYVAETSRGLGTGVLLLTRLVEKSEEAKFWTLQAGIFPENAGSVKIHEHAGFRVVGIRKRIGKMNEIWRDTLLLERRSERTGL